MALKIFPVLNFLLTRGITGRSSKLKRNCKVHHAFVVATVHVYGIQLLETEPCKASYQYLFNRHHIASNYKHLTVQRLFDIVRRHTKQHTTTMKFSKNFCVLYFRIPAGHPKIFKHRKFSDLRYSE